MSEQWFLDQARLGNVFHSHNTTAGAVTVIHATSTGLILMNPYGSGKDLVMKNMSFVGSTLSTIREIGIACSAATYTTLPSTTTAAVIHNARNKGSDIDTGVGVVYSIATMQGTPVWLRPLGSARVTNAVEGLTAMTAEFDGTFIVTPGNFILFSTLTAAATGLCSMTWAEADIVAN